MLADTKLSRRIDPPREFNPELIFFPDLSRVDLPGEFEFLSAAAGRLAENRLPKGDPAPRVRFITVEVVAFAGVAHGEDEIREIGSLIPSRSESDVATDEFRVAEGLDPGESVGITPDRIEDAGEIGIETPPTRFEKLRQEKAHFVMSQRVLVGEVQLVPELLSGRLGKQIGFDLVPAAGQGSTHGANRAGEHIQKVEAARDRPAPEIAAGSAPPVVGRQSRPGLGYLKRHLLDLFRRHSGLGLGKFRRVVRQFRGEFGDESREGPLATRISGSEVILPIDPVLQKRFVIATNLE